MSIKKGSYKLQTEERQESLKRRMDRDGQLRNVFPGQDILPQMTQFQMEELNGGKSASKDYSKEWFVDDHEIPLDQLLERYRTHPERGLVPGQVHKNLEAYGQNVICHQKRQSEWSIFLRHLLLGLNLLLWICGILCLLCYLAQFAYMSLDDIQSDNLWSAVALFVVVMIAGCFSYYQHFKSNKILQSFKSMIPQTAVVWRDGERCTLAVEEVVVGDVVDLQGGDRVPADVRVIQANCLKVDTSALTGESEPVKRSAVCTDSNPLETENLAFFSTNVLEGTCRAVVIRVGNSTFMGRMAELANESDPVATPLSKEMMRINVIISIISLGFGGIFFAIGLSMGYSLSDSVFFVVGIIVGNVPDNLNVALTMILALTAQRMAKKNCLVKHLHAVETLGSTNVICCDKTGTITQNKMHVSHVWFSNTTEQVDTSDGSTQANIPRGRLVNDSVQLDTPGWKQLAQVAKLCSRAAFRSAQDDVPILQRAVQGDASESAILKFLELQFGQVEEERGRSPKVYEIPFNSRAKFQVSVHSMQKDPHDTRHLVALKGAPERVVDMCSTILVGSAEHPMDDAWRAEVDQVYQQLGNLGERVLAFCDRRLDLADLEHLDGMLEEPQGMRFVGLISLVDPPRAAVPEAVAKCRGAGIKVVMITGDHANTAVAIARAVGILSKDEQVEGQRTDVRVDLFSKWVGPNLPRSVVITGKELSLLSPDQLDSIVTSYEELVFARTSPEQKLSIVESFQRQGNVVAVTGDGVNDAPSLRTADIGVAMGISGTDVAKEVADMVLLDDSFGSLSYGVENGRLIFDNIKKLIRFTMADNIAEMYCYWVFIILKVNTPMGTIAMLLSTSGIDMMSAISLSMEGPEADIMKLKPRNPQTDALMNHQMLSYAYGQVSVIETVGAFLAYYVTYACNGFLPKSLFGISDGFDNPAINDLTDSYGQDWTYYARQNLENQAATAFFVSLVVCQVVNIICCKTRRVSLLQKGMKNKFMMCAILFAPSLSCLFVYTPGLNAAANFVGIWWESWAYCVPFAAFLFLYDEARRYCIRTFGNDFIMQEFNA